LYCCSCFRSCTWSSNVEKIDSIIKAVADPIQRKAIVRSGQYDAGRLDLTFFPYRISETILHPATYINGINYSETPNSIIETSLEHIPNSNSEYGFTGRVKIDIKGKSIFYETNYTDGLIFESFEKGEIKDDEGNIYKGNYCKFRLKNIIKDISDFSGTSGAPIMDADGNIVALVAFGNKNKPYIYGIPVSMLKILVDVELINKSNKHIS